MPQVLTSIVINAPAQRVWSALIDTARYDEWNPVISDVSGNLRLGENIAFRIRLGAAKMPIDATVVRADGKELRWEGPANRRFRPLAWGSHFFRLEEQGPERIRFVHGEEFQGLLPKLAWAGMHPNLRKGYSKFNEALRKHCER